MVIKCWLQDKQAIEREGKWVAVTWWDETDIRRATEKDVSAWWNQEMSRRYGKLERYELMEKLVW